MKGVETAENAIPPHFRTTEELLQEFRYLGEEKAAEVVITNTNRIADKIEPIRPIPSGRHLLRAPGSDSTLRKVCTEKASELYGDPLPEVVASQLNRELETIIRRGYDEALLLVQKIVQKSTSNGYCVMPRSTLGASFAAYLLGVADGNPLPSHYRCAKCFYTDFESETVLQAYGGTGFDLPDKCCPCCGAPLQKDGLSIPFETFMGLNEEDNPEISVNFSGEYVSEIHRYTMDLLGKDRMIRAGAIRTIKRVSADVLVRDYLDDQKIHTSKQRAAQLTKLCAGTFCAHSYQPGSFFLLPEQMDVYDFTPLQRHPRRGESAFAETHFDSRALRNSFLELSELGHRTPTLLHELKALTGVDPAEIPFDDEKALSLFSSPEALGLTAEDLLGYSAGVLGVLEFDSPFLIKLLSQIQPNQFSDLIRADALAHGCGTWEPVHPAGSATSRLFTALAASGISIDVILRSPGPGGDRGRVSFSVKESDRAAAGAVLRACAEELGLESFVQESGLAKISAVGAGMTDGCGVAAQMLRALESGHIEPRYITTGEIRISVLVPLEEEADAVRLIHGSFFPAGPQTGGD